MFRGALRRISGGAAAMELEHDQTAFDPLYGVALAILLTFFLKETGSAGIGAVPSAASTNA